MFIRSTKVATTKHDERTKCFDDGKKMANGFAPDSKRLSPLMMMMMSQRINEQNNFCRSKHEKSTKK